MGAGRFRGMGAAVSAALLVLALGCGLGGGGAPTPIAVDFGQQKLDIDFAPEQVPSVQATQVAQWILPPVSGGGGSSAAPTPTATLIPEAEPLREPVVVPTPAPTATLIPAATLLVVESTPAPVSEVDVAESTPESDSTSEPGDDLSTLEPIATGEPPAVEPTDEPTLTSPPVATQEPPTAEPDPEPTVEPTPDPTTEPTAEPPTPAPTKEPTPEPDLGESRWRLARGLDWDAKGWTMGEFIPDGWSWLLHDESGLARIAYRAFADGGDYDSATAVLDGLLADAADGDGYVLKMRPGIAQNWRGAVGARYEANAEWALDQVVQTELVGLSIDGGYEVWVLESYGEVGAEALRDARGGMARNLGR